MFGILPEPKYDVIGGWSITPDQLYIGFGRLLYPFLSGLLISRILPKHRTESNTSGSPIRIRGGFWWCSLALVAIFCIPCPGGKPCILDGAFQALCILLIFPTIVLAGAGSRTTDTFSTKACKWLGELSYPLYITHYPFMYMQMGWVAKHTDAPIWQHLVLNAGVVIISIITAWCIYKTYDVPVRNWLTDKVLKRRR